MMFKKKIIAVLLSVGVVIACLPGVASAAASTNVVLSIDTQSITSTSVYLNGMIIVPAANEAIKEFYVQYSTSKNFNPSNSVLIQPIQQSYQTTYTLDNLFPETRYFVRILLNISVGGSAATESVASNVIELVTSQTVNAATFSHMSANFITSSVAQFNMTYSIPGSVNVSQVGFVYSPNSNAPTYNNNPTLPKDNYKASDSVSLQTTEPLQNGATYYYRAYVIYSAQGSGTQRIEYSETKTYTHNSGSGGSSAAVVSTVIANYADGRVYAEGRIASNISGAVDKGFVYSYSDPNPTKNANHGVAQSFEGNINFKANFIPRNDVTMCYVRAYADTSSGTHYGDTIELNFSTLKPVVITVDVDYVTSSSAEVRISTAANGNNALMERGVVYSRTNPNPAYDASGCVVARADNLKNGETVIVLDNLNRNTTYYVTAFAKSGSGITYGATLQFGTTQEDTILTLSPTNITNNSAKAGGILYGSAQGLAIREKGFVYSNTNSSPEITNSRNIVADNANAGEYWLDIKELAYDTIYYVRAYLLTSSNSYEYGAVRSFTTVNVSAVTITSIADVGGSMATVNANVSPEIVYNVVERGVVFSKINSDPIVDASNCAHIADPNIGTGDFTVTLTGLDRMTKYYAKAYARTSQGAYTYSIVDEFSTNDNLDIIINYVLSNGTPVATQTISAELNKTLDANSLSIPPGYYLQQSGFKHTVAGSTTIELVVLPLTQIPGVETEFVEGTGNYMFEPERQVTRVEVARMLYNLKADKTQLYVGLTFSDVTPDYEYYDVINFVTYMKYFPGGYPDGTFKPEREMTRRRSLR